MRRVDITYRITKIGKQAVSVAVCGLMVVGASTASGTTYNVFVDADRTIVRGTTTDSINVTYLNTNTASTTFTNLSNISITLNTGVNLTGETPVGLSGEYAIFTRQLRDGGDTFTDSVKFSDLGGSFLSTLNLLGNNSITGIIGVHIVRTDGATDSYSPASVVADPLNTINISGSGTSVIFNRQVIANNIELLSATSITFLGNIGGKINNETPISTIIDLNGQPVTLNFGNVTLTGSIQNNTATPGVMSNGTLIFSDNATITGAVGTGTTGVEVIQVNGNGKNVSFGGNVSANQLNYGAAANVTVTGSLLMNVDAIPSEVVGVTFSGTTGSLEIVGGALTGVAGQAVVTNSVNNRGTLTFTGDSDGNNASTNQQVTGHIGEATRSIATLNVGDASANNHAVVTVDGDIYATAVVLRNDSDGAPTAAFNSHLRLSAGRNLTGAVTTDSISQGDLTLLGGNQTVTGPVGSPTSDLRLGTVTSGNAVSASASIFTGDIYASTVTNVGGASSVANISSTTYKGDVFAGTVNIGNGISTFEQGLETYASGPVTSINIGTGVGNFNVNSTPPTTPFVKKTTGNITFTGAGTANLHQGLSSAVVVESGQVNFGGNNATVNLWHNQSISGAISTATTTSTGILNARGAGILNSTVGANGLSIQALNINTNNEQTGTANEDTRFLLANGNIYATAINLQNDGELRLTDGVDVTGAITTTTAVTGEGVLTLLGGNTIAGNVGSSAAKLKLITAGATGKVDTFTGGTVYATTLEYTGTGTVKFEGSSLRNPATFVGGEPDGIAGGIEKGFIGTVDFTGKAGTLQLGDNVDLDTVETLFANAQFAKLEFLGSSVVTGQLGDATEEATFKSIFAGAGEDPSADVVTFMNKVFVSDSTFHISGDGTVNFLDDLTGSLEFGSYDPTSPLEGDGTVNVASGKSIIGPVSTAVNATGTLNFVGSSETKASIGSSSAKLKEITFHRYTTPDDGYLGEVFAIPGAPDVTPSIANVLIGHSLNALSVKIGNSSYFTEATIDAIDLHLGDSLELSSKATLNTAGSFKSSSVSLVDFLTATPVSRLLNEDGTITPTAAVTQSTVGDGTSGTFITAGATLNFAIGTQQWASGVGGLVSSSASASSRISGEPGSELNMTGSESINIMLLGSLRNNVSYTLIDMTNATSNTTVPTNLKDNSYVITTALSRGSLGVTTTRADDVYIARSHDSVHFSNPAALRLGTLGALGTGYSEDMQTVFNKLDIDQWGFGNNEDNLAIQAKRLAPIANNAHVLTAFRAASLVGDSIGTRMHQLRIPEYAEPYEAKGAWVRTVNLLDKQGAEGQYDGFKSTISGAVLGLDAYYNEDALVGVAIGYSTANVKQQDFRKGDESTVAGAHLTIYGSYNITPELFIGGQVTHSWVTTDANRSTAVGRVAKADFSSAQISSKVDIGYRLQIPDTAVFITPVASVESSILDQEKYSETNAGAIGLNVNAEKFKRQQAAVGLRIEGTTDFAGIVIKPELAVLATRDTNKHAKPIVATFIGDNDSELITTQVAQNGQRNGFKVSLGMGILLSKSTSMAIRYEHARIAEDKTMTEDTNSSHALDINFRWNF